MISLPIKKILLACFGIITIKWKKIIQISLFPIGSIFLLTNFAFDLTSFIEAPQEFMFEIIILALVNLLLYSILSVNIHRMVILGDDSIPLFGILFPNSQVLKFYSWIIFIISFIFFVNIVLISLLMLLFAQTNSVTTFISIFISYYILIRLSIALPAISTNTVVRFQTIWELTKGQMPQLIIILAGFPLLILVISNLILNLLGANIFGAIFINFIQIFMLVWGIVSIALCYQELIKKANQQQQNL